MPTFSFIATWRGATLHFHEVTGLENNSLAEPPSTSPQMIHRKKIRLKRGVIVAPKPAADWLREIQTSSASIAEPTLTIHLLDESKKPVMTWELHGATVASFTSVAENPTGNEVAVESIEIAYETLIISAP